MDLPTVMISRAEFNSLPVSSSGQYDQTRCRHLCSTGQWIFIDRDFESAPVAVIVLHDWQPDDSEKLRPLEADLQARKRDKKITVAAERKNRHKIRKTDSGRETARAKARAKNRARNRAAKRSRRKSRK